MQVLQNRLQLCLSCRLGRLFNEDFLHMCLEVYLLCLVLPVRDILKKLRHVFMFLSSPEEDGMYGYSMWSFLLLCVLWRCSVTGHFYSITPTKKYGEEHERKAVISSCLDYNKGKRRTDRRHRFMLQSILSISGKPVTWFSALYCLWLIWSCKSMISHKKLAISGGFTTASLPHNGIKHPKTIG